MVELWKRFKALTGYRGQDVANMTNVSRQHISYLTVREGNGVTNKSAVCYWMEIMIDKKLDSLKNEISQLDRLKVDIRKNVIADLESGE
jgi:hypothetical protein